MNLPYFDLINSPLKGTNLIEASAGTGKTYIIAGLFVRLILEKGILADKILTVTYTEAATEELRYRIRERLKDALKALTDGYNHSADDELISHIVNKYKNNESALWRLKDALTRFDEASICTIHGFCKRMLAENAFESNSLFNAELLKDQSKLIQEIVDDFWRKNFYNASQLLVQYAVKNNINTSGFLKLVNNLSIDPSFEVTPKLKKPAISKTETRFLDAFKKLHTDWQSNKSVIEEILISNEGLNGSKYGKHSPKLITEMDEYLSSDNPVMMFEAFRKFTTGAINDSIKKGFTAPKYKFFDDCEIFLKIYESTMSALEKYVLFLETELFNFVRSEADKKKQKLNVITFDDLLVNMHKALGQGNESVLAKAVRARYKAALIDEFQDSDPVQYSIFNNIFSNPGSVLFLIGDPKQSIYKFRGADIFAYIKAARNIKSKYTLGTNWRSTPELLKAINIIFGKKERPFVFEDILYHPVKAAAGNIKKETDLISPLNIWILGQENAERKDGVIPKGKAINLISNAVAGEILRLVSGSDNNIADEYTIKPGHIAVLVRKNFQARLVQKELQKFNIPGVLYGSESIFQSHEAGELERILSSIASPGNDRLLKSALATDMIGLTGNDIFNLASEEMMLENYINRFYRYHDLWVNHGFFRMFRQFVENEGVRGILLSFTDGERRMTNIMQLAEILNSAEIENKLGIETMVKWLNEKRSNPDESEEYEIRLETDDDAVKILTIHRSKGLEFPVVFCPFAWGESDLDKDKPYAFHNPDNNYNFTLDLACDPGNRIIAEAEELAENMRLLYVALTRARHRAYFFWGRINETETSAPAYIFNYKNNDWPDPVSRLRDDAQFLNYESIIRNIDSLAKESGGAICVHDVPKFEYKRRISTETNHEFSSRIFTGKIKNDWNISSFSALTHDAKEFTESPDHDRVYSNAMADQKLTGSDRNIFSFPKGASAGSCIHEIFENIDFTFFEEEPVKKLINDALTRYNIENIWQQTIFDMVNKVLNTSVLPGMQEFSLKNISKNGRLSELEFYYPLNLITSAGLANIFRKYGINISNNFTASLEHLGFTPHRGFIKGYMDLVFHYKEKYFIVDWKSNHLGNDIQDYSPEKINTVMDDNYYILQYYIYTVALHRFLLLRKADYDYSKHFGGVIYIFVRGTDPEYPYSGIYNDIPSKEIIQSLSEYLSNSKAFEV
jgi:exodeoxyribonuclease V beta subunit